MKSFQKILISAVLMIAGTAAAFAGGSAESGDGESASIAVFNNQHQIALGVIEGITEAFEAEFPGIEVDYQSIGKDYESMMKVKMASNDLPDVFSTHGWAVMRYGEYTYDLSGQEWAGKVKDSIRDIITDDEGALCALPMDLDITGMTYNKALFEEYGLDVPRNFDELLDVCGQIVEKSNGTVVPLHYGGGDSWPIGGYYNFASTGYFVSDPAHDYRDELMDGTFDWSMYDVVSENFLKLKELGYLNPDILTAKYSDSVTALATGKAAIGGCYGAYIISEIKKINPDFEAGMMPLPAYYPDDEPTYVGGERTTWAVWKDSKSLEAALTFVDFFARPENLQKVAEANGIPAGLTGVEASLGDLESEYERFEDIRIFPYLDRAYLPNGMWDVMCINGQDLLAGAITPSEYSANMEKEYKRLGDY